MSKYLVSAGVVWVFMAFVIGVIMLLVPAERQGVVRHKGLTAQSGGNYQGEVTPVITSNVAKTSVQVEGTPATELNAAPATVQVLTK